MNTIFLKQTTVVSTSHKVNADLTTHCTTTLKTNKKISGLWVSADKTGHV